MNEQIKNTETVEGAKATDKATGTDKAIDKATEPKQQKKKRNNNNNNETVKELRVAVTEQDLKIIEGIRKRNKNCCSLSASVVQAIRMYNQFLYQETKKQEQIEQMDKNIKELLELLKNKDITTDTVDTGAKEGATGTETIEQATGTVEGVAEIGKIKKNKKIVINYKNSIKTTEKEQMNRRVNKDLLKKWNVLCKMNRHINSSELVNQALYEFIMNHS